MVSKMELRYIARNTAARDQIETLPASSFPNNAPEMRAPQQKATHITAGRNGNVQNKEIHVAIRRASHARPEPNATTLDHTCWHRIVNNTAYPASENQGLGSRALESLLALPVGI